MAHIAVITTGLRGILNASFELLKRLESSGMEVSYLCPIDVKAQVEQQGFKYVQLPKVLFNISDKTQLTQAKTNLLECEVILKEVKPEFILIDEELHEIIFVALKLQIKVKLLSQFFCHQKRHGLPPLRTSIIPGRGPNGTAFGIQTTWVYIKLKIYGRLWLNKILAKDYRRRLLLAYFKKIDFPVGSLISRSFPSLFIHTNLPVLSMTMEELEFPHKRAKNMRYIGAMVYDEKVHSEKNVLPESLRRILDLRKKDPAKKLVYCSVSSLNTGDQAFLHKVVNVVSSEPNWLLVLSLGGKLDPSKFELETGNICVLSWVPQLEILKLADCSITHGGIHTIHECIHFKVPMIVYSGKRHDQNGNAARVAYHGLGLQGDKDNDDEKSLKNKIEQVLTEATFSAKIDAINTVYKEYKKKNLTSLLK